MERFETVTDVNAGIKLIQDPKGLTYGTDAYLLSAFIRRSPSAMAAEYGSGSGIISLLLASSGKVGKITAIEAQEYYAELTGRNAELNGFSEKIESVHADIREYRNDGGYDIIFTNPPYMKADSGKKNEDGGKYAARHETAGGIYDFCKSAARNLKFGGLFYCVYRPDRMAELLSAMRECGIEPKRTVFVSSDTAHKPCLMLTEGKRGAMSGCEVLRHLFLTRAEDGQMTEDAKTIYETGDWC